MERLGVDEDKSKGKVLVIPERLCRSDKIGVVWVQWVFDDPIIPFEWDIFTVGDDGKELKLR